MTRRGFIRSLCAAALAGYLRIVPSFAPARPRILANELHRDFMEAYARKYMAIQADYREAMARATAEGFFFSGSCNVRRWG